MIYCLDTNILIDFLHNDEKIKLKLAEHMDSCCLTPVALCELYRGAFLGKKPIEAVQDINQISLGFDLLKCNVHACRLFGQEYAKLQALGKPTQLFDLMMGCTALAHGATLVTRNPKDFASIAGLKIVEW